VGIVYRRLLCEHEFLESCCSESHSFIQYTVLRQVHSFFQVEFSAQCDLVLPVSTYSIYVEMKCQLDATEFFIADLIACSTCFGHHYAHHQELKSIIQWLLPVLFGAAVFKLLVECGAEGYVSGLQDAAASCKPDT